MTTKLSTVQKHQIDKLLASGVATPATQTIGDRVKKVLKLSDSEYTKLQDEIGDHVEAFFEKYDRG